MTNDELTQEIQQLKTKVGTLNENQKFSKEELILSAWIKIVETQMHFNDMVMKVRNLAITLVLAVFGAAAYSIQTPIFLNAHGREIHVAFFIICFGLAGWVALWIIDVSHFHKLLRGAVEYGMELEREYKGDPTLGKILGMTTRITEHSRKWFGRDTSAAKKVAVFYLVVFLSGIGFLYATFDYIHKDDLGFKSKEQIIRLTTDNPNGIIIKIDRIEATFNKEASIPGEGSKKKSSK